jgi:GntR family transcriptional regulator
MRAINTDTKPRNGSDMMTIPLDIRAKIAIATNTPLYEIVRRYVSEAIVMGKWVPGTVLPGEEALAHSFGVAVGTVRRALTDLTREGLLTRRRKTGTVVTGRAPHHSLRSFYQYFRLHGADGSLVRSTPKVLSVKVGLASDTEKKQLGLKVGAHVIRIHRLRCVGGRPVLNQRITLPEARLPGFPTQIAKVPDVIFAFLLEQYGIRVSVVHEWVTAELATPEDLRVLNLTQPAAILRIEDVTQDQTGAAIQFGVQRATTALHTYRNEIS